MSETVGISDRGPKNLSRMILLRSLDDFPEALRGGAVAIGNFDGVHLGHARLIERLRTMAERVGGPAVVFTFDPPPTRILRPEMAPEPLLWLDRKIEILAELGADAVLVYPTDKALLEMEARQFFEHIVRDQLAARAMVEGPNFFFGRHRSGNVEVLRQFCAEAEMPFEVAEPVEIEGQIVSSSRIRSLVMAGRLDEAQAMLGRPYRIRGRRGSRGGPRRASSAIPPPIWSRSTRSCRAKGFMPPGHWPGDVWYPAAVSLGPNPTFDEGS